MNKFILYLMGAIAIILVTAFLFFSGKEYVITIPEKTIQEKIEEKMPFKKTYFLFFDVMLNNPRVDLVEGSNRINAGLDISVSIKMKGQEKSLSGHLDVSGSLVYVSDEVAFYLSDPVIESLLIQGFPEESSVKITNMIEKALVNFYSSRPVYRLNASTKKQLAARLVLKNLVVHDQAVVVTLGI